MAKTPISRPQWKLPYGLPDEPPMSESARDAFANWIADCRERGLLAETDDNPLTRHLPLYRPKP